MPPHGRCIPGELQFPAAGRERCGKTGYQSGIPVLVLVWLACWSGSLDSQLQGVVKLGAQSGQGTRIAIRFPLHAVSARSSIAEAGCVRPVRGS